MSIAININLHNCKLPTFLYFKVGGLDVYLRSFGAYIFVNVVLESSIVMSTTNASFPVPSPIFRLFPFLGRLFRSGWSPAYDRAIMDPEKWQSVIAGMITRSLDLTDGCQKRSTMGTAPFERPYDSLSLCWHSSHLSITVSYATLKTILITPGIIACDNVARMYKVDTLSALALCNQRWLSSRVEHRTGHFCSRLEVFEFDRAEAMARLKLDVEK